MNFIVADIGNTFIKICTVDEKTLKIKRTNLIRSDKQINFLKINKIFKKKIRKEVLFASVVPKKFFLLKKYLKNKFDLKATEIKSLNLKQLVKLDIKKPNQVGSDRISNAIGVLKNYSSDSIVIDFGTATTFDVVF
jgi:type III pantothenate kinase